MILAHPLRSKSADNTKTNVGHLTRFRLSEYIAEWHIKLRGAEATSTGFLQRHQRDLGR